MLAKSLFRKGRSNEAIAVQALWAEWHLRWLDAYTQAAPHLHPGQGALVTPKELLQGNADANAADRTGRTCLHEAVHQDDFEVSALLLEHGAAVNARTEVGDTPLHLAAYPHLRENSGVVALLLEHKAEVNSRNAFGATPLHMKVGGSFGTEVAALLLEHKADVNARMLHGLTPLHKAAMFGSAEVVGLLLDHRAEVNARAQDGQTPLAEAAESGESVRDLLLRHGATD